MDLLRLFIKLWRVAKIDFVQTSASLASFWRSSTMMPDPAKFVRSLTMMPDPAKFVQSSTMMPDPAKFGQSGKVRANLAGACQESGVMFASRSSSRHSAPLYTTSSNQSGLLSSKAT